ncbi:MAG TPA: sodium/proton-translocating pyrophosphatase [Spirochaetota bacterium]|nr:sodium/proton-translocating pyrophosphatase [Spirochaetota bacterium]HPL15830.1 sodium/proton-translocating pyrophosphatase [Spirochaetota bacterium]HRS76648.1 sodium/proton-translocating pyrophosphatase [Spirochaetota bacterium]HRT74101.1 sodium/proton-translocating pyrophosphatase [Spirochaetota bacterium]
MKVFKRILLSSAFLFSAVNVFASEADLAIPDLHAGSYTLFGGTITAWQLLFYGALVICGTLGISLFQFFMIKKEKAHESMLKVAEIIYQTCRTYLLQQGKFLLMLFAFIAVAMAFYFLVMKGEGVPVLLQILLFSVIGMAGSYSVAWYGIRVNTLANARTAFASLEGKPWNVVNIPLRAGMSVGLFLISLELVMMVIILLFVPRTIVGYCFLGFAIGESLGASALRIAGGIFTKIADIGSDLMKIVFKVKEDDPRNPGVIADCTGDNAGDSVGPTADGFETYGVTGVALISFITLAITVPDIMGRIDVAKILAAAGVATVSAETVDAIAKLFQAELQSKLIVWIFAMRFLMDFLSGCSYFVNQAISTVKYKGKTEFDFEEPLMRLIWIAAVLCISVSFGMSYLLLGNLDLTMSAAALEKLGVKVTETVVFAQYPGIWWKLAMIISCGTLAAVLIPEFTKIFTSSKSKHVNEIVTATREGGSSLTILSGIVAGNFSAFWMGILIAGLMTGAYVTSLYGLADVMGPYASIFAFGMVAFGFLCMGPVTIAVDSYGPVTDNAQSIFELSQIEAVPNIKADIKKNYGFDPNFELGKHYLEANDGAGNTFKATAKPVLIGTAVVGATTMIFAIILLLKKVGFLKLSLTDAPVILGFICGGAVIFWFAGASMQAVTTGAYRAVEFIKKNLNLDKTEADLEDSKTVVRICTQYAQKGMWNIFIALMTLTLAFAFVDPNFFVAYLISIACFGLFEAIYMANAGGAWDNAKKVVEVDLKEKGSELHAASVVGDTVGDPFKDTSSVSMNPIIKFSTLFGLLATEIAIEMKLHAIKAATTDWTIFIAIPFFVIGLIFVWRSFYAMRIPPRI